MKMRNDYIRFGKFLIVGIMNTLVSYLAYIILRIFDLDPYLCNVLSYLIGVINSFLWNKIWVFQARNTNVRREILIFSAVFLVCYGFQFLLFRILLGVLHWDEYVSQFLGMCLYTVLNFCLNRILTFKNEMN